MMDERTMEALARTWKHLVRHLEDLNDEVDQADGRIKDHMVVDGMKDCVRTIRCIREEFFHHRIFLGFFHFAVYQTDDITEDFLQRLKAFGGGGKVDFLGFLNQRTYPIGLSAGI